MCFVDIEVVAKAHTRVIMTVYSHVIGITLLWQLRPLTRELGQL